MANNVYNKDKKVKIFYLVTTRDEEGFKITIKKYIHPLNKSLSAYVRDLSQREVQANKQVQDDSTIQVVINRRPINNSMFVEYKRRGMDVNTYNISGIDYYDDTTNDIKFNGSLVNQKLTYDKVEGTDWNE